MSFGALIPKNLLAIWLTDITKAAERNKGMTDALSSYP
jgi:hypothetical protein